MLKPVPGRPGAFVDEAGQVFTVGDFVGPHLSLAGVRARFPKAPITMGTAQMAREIFVLGLRIAWAAVRGRFYAVCVCLVRLKELVEEIEGKPYNHGDHWT